jgi:hypothetical protein
LRMHLKKLDATLDMMDTLIDKFQAEGFYRHANPGCV